MTELPDAARIRDLLGPGSLWREVRVVESTGSTNADVAAAAKAGEPPWMALIAAEQTAGRGRLGRHWVSPKGSSISMSLLTRPQRPVPEWGWLSLLPGMAVAGAVADLASEASRVQLKWPNDVLIDGRKVCGILSEFVETSAGPCAVVGIGINITLTEAELPVPGATSLALAGFGTDQSRLAAGVLSHFERLYRQWERQGSLREAYSQRCASIGAALTVHADGQRISGTGFGVDESGRLQVLTDDGVRTFAVGDVVHARLGHH